MGYTTMFFTEVTDEFYEFGVIAFEMLLYIKVFKFSTRSTMLSLCFFRKEADRYGVLRIPPYSLMYGFLPC